ncbi:hypothetical protein GCM10011409_25400 [Lentibacillus populi]|uniref:Uncharacterized protein n=1 Tax=Lentibacillus populi TaxID=1827502 RepID=A0A9W5TYS8_9BACI|nr:hypothetical protein GCM10011409_25400 [Lentibacillus populi]
MDYAYLQSLLPMHLEKILYTKNKKYGIYKEIKKSRKKEISIVFVWRE